MLTYIKKKKFLCTQVADPQSAFSERDTSESWTLLLNKKSIYRKRNNTVMKPGERHQRLSQHVVWRNVGAVLAFQRLLSLGDSSLIAKVSCLMVYRRWQVRHGWWGCTCGKVASNSRSCKTERKAGTFCISQEDTGSSTQYRPLESSKYYLHV